MKNVQKIAFLVLMVFGLYVVNVWARTVIDLSKDARFTSIMGRSLKTRKALVVYHFKRRANSLFLGGIGSNPYLPSVGNMGKIFPYRHQGTTLLGLLPSGSVLKVVRVTEEGSRTATFTHYYVEVAESSDPQWIGRMAHLDAVTADSPPKFDDLLLEEIP